MRERIGAFLMAATAVVVFTLASMGPGCPSIPGVCPPDWPAGSGADW